MNLYVDVIYDPDLGCIAVLRDQSGEIVSIGVDE